jgi:hypothetical protein
MSACRNPPDIFSPHAATIGFAGEMSHSVLPKNPERSKVIADKFGDRRSLSGPVTAVR